MATGHNGQFQNVSATRQTNYGARVGIPAYLAVHLHRPLGLNRRYCSLPYQPTLDVEQALARHCPPNPLDAAQQLAARTLNAQ